MENLYQELFQAMENAPDKFQAMDCAAKLISAWASESQVADIEHFIPLFLSSELVIEKCESIDEIADRWLLMDDFDVAVLWVFYTIGLESRNIYSRMNSNGWIGKLMKSQLFPNYIVVRLLRQLIICEEMAIDDLMAVNSRFIRSILQSVIDHAYSDDLIPGQCVLLLAALNQQFSRKPSLDSKLMALLSTEEFKRREISETIVFAFNRASELMLTQKTL